MDKIILCHQHDFDSAEDTLKLLQGTLIVYDDSMTIFPQANEYWCVKKCPIQHLPPATIRIINVETVPKEPRIGLCMIVKNESHIIHESLNCIIPLVDTYCIVDTGSTDNTIECIEKAVGDVKGKVHCREWKDFGTNRSEALKLCDGEMDYCIMMDADDLMEFPKGAKQWLVNMLRQHQPNACNIQIKRGNLTYARTQIFKMNDGWRYEGVLHEYPTNDKPNNRIVNLPTEFFMVGRCLGDRSRQEGNKYLRDAEVIEKELEKNPENERYMFYLAQSYRDGGNLPKAVEWYKKRVEAGKWMEEVYISALNIARIEHSKEWVWKAHEINPKRIEAFVSYLARERMEGRLTKENLAMAMYASTIPKPNDQQLFIENDVYEWKIFDELGILACYNGRPDLGKQMFQKILTKVPEDQKSRIENNLKCLP